jgi:molybdopterin-biosynthesis enzyme MoeA-like protein
MQIGAIIIGDELLSGKRQDSHFNYLQTSLAKRGLELGWTMMLGDDFSPLQRFLEFSLASDDIVFSFGGIGATPDDRTRQATAAAINKPLHRHPEAVAEIEAQYGEAAYPNRILMADLPVDSRLIPNTINNVPGFSINQHHFMPGFPEMAWPMIEWVLDTHYPDLKNTAPKAELTIYVTQGREADLLDLMHAVLNDYSNIRLSSLPRHGKNGYIELSIRGAPQPVNAAMEYLKSNIVELGFIWQSQPPIKN